MSAWISRFSNLFKKGFSESGRNRLEKEILSYYLENEPGDEEIGSALEHIRENGISVFPAGFSGKYDDMDVLVLYDESCSLRYVLHDGKRLYFPEKWTERRIRLTYIARVREQDPDCPHCYQNGDFRVGENDNFFDIGCAEALLALNMADRVKRIFLFENDKQWLAPLRMTFRPWKEKTVIINKLASDANGKRSVTIDDTVKRYGVQGPLFVKMDVEGGERPVLAGMKNTLETYDGQVKVVICTYHNQQDHAGLSAFMQSKEFAVSTSNGYMLFLYDPKGLKPPYFRRGAIYCTKK